MGPVFRIHLKIAHNEGSMPRIEIPVCWGTIPERVLGRRRMWSIDRLELT